MKYAELKSKQRKEFNEFPIGFAFSKKQLDESLAELGATKEEVIGVGAGGFIRKTDKKAFIDLAERHDNEMEGAMQDDDFLMDAIEYELANHEFCITYDPGPALSALGLSLKDERVESLYQKARKSYFEGQRKLEEESCKQ